MDYFPLFADLKGRSVLVVGAGGVALRKISLLLKCGAAIRIAAESLHPQIQSLHEAGRVEWAARAFSPELLDSAFLAVAATNDSALNEQVFQAAQQRRLLVNTVDDPARCNFIFPSIIDRHPIQIAISSGGQAPVLARLLREKLEALLPQGLGVMAGIAGQWRGRVKAKLGSTTQRRRFWEKLFTSAAFQRLADSRRSREAECLVRRQLAGDWPQTGEVALVGAGPGDAGLLTLKGLQRIQEADVVLYDALVSEQVLELVRRDADKICVGKRARGGSVPQEETNRLLVRYALAGKRVVRLKGGDPFVFGRGGEELEALREAGIPFEVVPGITAALGAAAYAGIPLTHRDHVHSAMFITGHRKINADAPDWQALAQSRQTLVVYMGTIKAAELSRELIAHGRAADTPAAVVGCGTLPGQQVFSGSLSELPELAAQAPQPALLIIGETAALHHRLAWFGEQPALSADRSGWYVLPDAGAERPAVHAA
ncbi:uroporphyrinogen-III C-methyltransferase [Eikenella longinqua]|uniref:Siroheme synthase n=2 Tax=Eikenella TaxID=538 RepID=A0A1A9RVU8_9NEIS|nr:MULTISPECIES: siroheme synthase CysG [Eikenella]OAM27826.1 uroporphyrinogen-III C-methyltransferase [Eikenella longinqua]